MVSSSTQTVELPEPEVKPVETTVEPGSVHPPQTKPFTIKIQGSIPT